MKKSCLIFFSFIMAFASCKAGSVVTQSGWGEVDGEGISLYTFENENGMVVAVSNFGASIVKMAIPDVGGKLTDVVGGYDALAELVADKSYQGPLVGRYANRIKDGKFEIDGESYQLSINENTNHIHGGISGFGKKVWASSIVAKNGGDVVVMTYTSEDGEEGYPGKMTVTVEFDLDGDNNFAVEISAVCDAATVVNLTPHLYFNLNGEGSVLDHRFKINGSAYLPTDAQLIPTGQLTDVTGTPFDFRNFKKIGQDINVKNPDLVFGGGYDHNWVIDGFDGTMREQCHLIGDKSGIQMQIFANQPGLQFYSGNFLDGSITGKGSVAYGLRSLIVLEPQNFPDAPNHENFPNAVLRPGEVYNSKIIYRLTL
ncbi:MAG: galactose mutarotase [Spirochaetales bacterium]|nr:galactose mutarotase [Spirochaetales bacterium]